MGLKTFSNNSKNAQKLTFKRCLAFFHDFAIATVMRKAELVHLKQVFTFVLIVSLIATGMQLIQSSLSMKTKWEMNSLLRLIRNFPVRRTGTQLVTSKINAMKGEDET